MKKYQMNNVLHNEVVKIVTFVLETENLVEHSNKVIYLIFLVGLKWNINRFLILSYIIRSKDSINNIKRR